MNQEQPMVTTTPAELPAMLEHCFRFDVNKNIRVESSGFGQDAVIEAMEDERLARLHSDVDQYQSDLSVIDFGYQPVMVWGKVGIGKSAIVKQTGLAHSVPVIDLRAVLLEAVDVRGLPHLVTEDGHVQVNWAAPGFLPSDPNWEGIIFFDELNRAATSVQSACLQLILDRKCGEYELPKKARLVAACNPETSKGTVATSDALDNRFLHLYLEGDLESFLSWGTINNALHPFVIGTLRRYPECFSNYRKGAHAFSTPRSLKSASDMMTSRKLTDREFQVLISGLIGEDLALKIQALKTMYIPTAQEILKDPEGIKIPNDPSVKYVMCSSLARKLTDDQTFAKALPFIYRIEPDYQVMLIQDTRQVNQGKAEKWPSFMQWCAKNLDTFKKFAEAGAA